MTDFIGIKAITTHEVIEREAQEGAGREISNGIWAEKTEMAGELHNQIILNVTLLIAPFVKKRQLGRFYGDNLNFVLSGSDQNIHVMRIPDMAFVSSARLQPIQDGFLFLAPDIAMEVVSPTETKTDTAEKIADYLQFGTQEVWVIYPNALQVGVYYVDGRVKTYEFEETLTTPLLPDFALVVSSIFEM